MRDGGRDVTVECCGVKLLHTSSHASREEKREALIVKTQDGGKACEPVEKAKVARKNQNGLKGDLDSPTNK